ncbi:hypothetical protein B0T09DRAFT_305665 [Sordaria sp. MPI-SDFR-AT-0083]|nr:hypothetical protein B0T09DRAFT_305665 [Sordaria sp. MPI-SDFR-AT-0083]
MPAVKPEPHNAPSELYRAEVEFITSAEWFKELQDLYSDLLDGNAVYPRLVKETMPRHNPVGLVNQPSVRSVLGTTRKLQATTAGSVYRQLQSYVDSKEKNTDKSIEYWTLIKVVRIYTKASVLSTGVCLVDLPGVQDSNAARAAVAANYMKACTGLWIVAPITRAVDDKTGKSLLGDSFKRQLKYDGAYSAVTFICSKTDDISVIEAMESLNLEDRVSEHEAQIRSKEDDIKKLKKKVVDLKDQIGACEDIRDHLDEEVDKWEVLLDKFDKGEQRRGGARGSRKRRNNNSTDSDTGSGTGSDSGSDGEDSDAERSDSSDKENSDPKVGGEKKPLTKEDIESKIYSLRDEKKKARAEVKAICIQGRNNYSRTAIKKDFAMGIKELDQETAIEEDEENFDSDVDLRNYDEVAETLPVFCVSSRAFQKLSGKMVRDKFNSAGFRSLEEAEIPQLQAHAQKLTENGRAVNCRRFLADLSDSQLDEYELNDVVKETLNNLKEALAENIYEILDKYLPEKAVPTASGWGAHRDAGGLFWATYKATCRRNGVYSGASGPRDFNAELIEPIYTPLSTAWERTFQRRLPGVLKDHAKSTKLLLETFHREATMRSQQRGNNPQGINMLALQLQAHGQKVSELPDTLNANVQDLQRDANRTFTPEIQTQMERAYVGCVDERSMSLFTGPGSCKRMKDIMVGHVGAHRMTMFQAATRVVQDQLDLMCREIKKRLQDEAEDLHDILSQDYLATLIGAEVAGRKGLPRVERALRAEMVPLLQKTDPVFAPVVGGEPEEPEKVEEPEQEEKRAASEGLFVAPDAAANEADSFMMDTSMADASMVDAPPPSSAPTATSTIKAEPVEPAPAVTNDHNAPVQPAVAAPQAATPPKPLQAGTAAPEAAQVFGVAHERTRAATAGLEAVGTANGVPRPPRAATDGPDPISNIKREPLEDRDLFTSFCSERNPNSDDEEEGSTATEGKDDEGDDDAESSSDEDSSRAPSVDVDLVKPEPTDQ